MHAVVHAADIQDRDGGVLLMTTLFGFYPFLRKLYADGGCQGPEPIRGLHQGQRSIAASTGRTYDRTRPTRGNAQKRTCLQGAST